VDRFPLRVSVGGDNTGTESTGVARYFAGITWGNAFFVDDLWSYQFTMNHNFNRFSSHTMSYLSFLPWEHMLTLTGVYARIHPDIAGFFSSGKDAQASFRYKIPFHPLYTRFQHNFHFGIDYKYFTNVLFFVGEVVSREPIMSTQVNVLQAMLGYQLEYDMWPHRLSFCFDVFASPVQCLPHQSNRAYSAMRRNAVARYFYFKTSLGEVYTFPSKDSISFTVRMQGTSNTLIPSEQFSLGGYHTVRGYEQSVFVADNAVCVNCEVRSRPFPLLKKIQNGLTIIAFLDYGWGYNYHAFDGITKSAVMVGVGPGCRYTIGNYLEFHCDYGIKLNSVKLDDNKLGTYHIGIVLGY
jgi:hemolysin activation/secretion protein